MSVRATGSLIAEVVIASGIPNGPRMIVSDVDPDKKTVTTIWFSDTHEAQQGVFPASALDRAADALPSTPASQNAASKK